MVNQPAPSMTAASSSSLGMLRKYWWKKKTEKALATNGTIWTW